jgi:hypothetical protein
MGKDEWANGRQRMGPRAVVGATSGTPDPAHGTSRFHFAQIRDGKTFFRLLNV